MGILEPIPFLRSSSGTAGQETTAKNILGDRDKKKAGQIDYLQKLLTEDTQLKTIIQHKQHYAKLEQTGHKLAMALMEGEQPTDRTRPRPEEIFFKVEEYDMGEIINTQVWRGRYGFENLPTDYLDNPPPPAPPIWEQVPCAEAYYDEAFNTTNHDIYFTHYVDEDGYTYHNLSNVTEEDYDRTDSTTSFNTIDILDHRVEYLPDDYDWLYQSVGSGSYSYSISEAYSVNGETKCTFYKNDGYSLSWNNIWDEFDNVMIRCTMNKAGQIREGSYYQSVEAIGGGSVLAAWMDFATSYGPEWTEYDCGFLSPYIYRLSTSNPYRESGQAKASINSTAFFSSAYSDTYDPRGMKSNEETTTGCFHPQNTIIGANARDPHRVHSGPQSIDLAVCFGGGPYEFFGFFAVDNEDSTSNVDQSLKFFVQYSAYYVALPVQTAGAGSGTFNYTQDVYFVSRSLTRGRSLKCQKLFTVQGGWGDNYGFSTFVTNDWIIAVLNPVANWDTDEYSLIYYCFERNYPFRVFTKSTMLTYSYGAWITAWRRIVPE